MSERGKLIARNLQKKYTEAEKVIIQSDRKYFNLLSVSDKIWLGTQIADMCFELARNNGRKSLRKFWNIIEFGRREKIKNYQKMIRWMKKRQKKSL